MTAAATPEQLRWLLAAGRPLVTLSLLFRELAAECERAAGIRFSDG